MKKETIEALDRFCVEVVNALCLPASSSRAALEDCLFRLQAALEEEDEAE